MSRDEVNSEVSLSDPEEGESMNKRGGGEILADCSPVFVVLMVDSLFLGG